MSAIIIPFPQPTAPSSEVEAALGADASTGEPEAHWVRQAVTVLDQIEAMVEGAAVEVVTLCEQAIHCLVDAAPEIDDAEAVEMLIDRLHQLHLRASRREALVRAAHPSGRARSESRPAARHGCGMIRPVSRNDDVVATGGVDR